MLYIFQYQNPSPHYICAVIPKCNRKLFKDNPNVVLTVGGGEGLFDKKKDLDHYKSLILSCSGPILPAIRHMDLRGKAWKKPHIINSKLIVSEALRCRELSSIKMMNMFDSDFKFSEFLKTNSFWLWENATRSVVEPSRIVHLPFDKELSGDFTNYFLFVQSLFVSKRKTYEELILAADLSPFLDPASDIDDTDLLNTARNNLDSLFYLSSEQSSSWYTPLES